MATPTITNKKFILCPECGRHDWCIQHLVDGAKSSGEVRYAGPWYCDDCGYGFILWVRVLEGRVIVNTQTYSDRKYKEYVVLDIPTQAPIRIIIESRRFEPNVTEDHLSYLRFKYEENTNPENIFRYITGVLNDLSVNFEFIKVTDDPDEHLKVVDEVTETSEPPEGSGTAH